MQSGGTVRLTAGGTNGLIIGQTALSGTNPGSAGSYTLSAGLLSVTGRVYVGFGGNGSFTQTGGTNTINGRLLLAVTTGTNTATADYSLQGGTLSVSGDGIIQLNTGGTFSQTGGSLSYLNFNMDGGTVNGTLNNGGSFNYTAGTFNGRLVNSASAAMSLSADFTAGNGMQNAATLSFGSNRTVALDGAGLLNTGTIQLQGGQLSGGGPLVNSGTLNGTGVIAGTGGFTNNANWTLNLGSFRLLNTGPNGNFGTITVPASTAGVSLVLDDPAVLLNNFGTILLGTNGSIGGAGGLINRNTGVISGSGAIVSSSFTNQGQLNVGIAGVGDLTVTPAFVNSGTITLTGGSNVLGGGAITNSGNITGGGQINNTIVNTGNIAPAALRTLTLAGAVQNQIGGTLSAPTGTTLTANGLTTNAGTISIASAGIFSTGVFTNTGSINVSGTLDADGISNTGAITYSGAGAIDSFGPITNNAGGSIAVTTGLPTVLIYDNLTHSAGASLSVASGATLNLLGNASGGGDVTNHGTINFATLKTYALGRISGSGTAMLFDGAALTAKQIVQGTLTINGAGSVAASVTISPNATPGTLTNKLNNLNIAGGLVPTAKLDLSNTNLLLDYSLLSPAGTVRAQLRSGYNASGAHWTGNGIASSSAAADGTTALGYGEASTVLGLSGTQTASWFGQTADATSVLVRYTKNGDATLDGSVDFNDLVRVAQNYNVVDGARVWYDGDFNYDGNVDFNDLVVMAQNYNTALPGAPLPADVSPAFAADFARVAGAPEPSGLFVCGIVTLGFISRRRRVRNQHRDTETQRHREDWPRTCTNGHE